MRKKNIFKTVRCHTQGLAQIRARGIHRAGLAGAVQRSCGYKHAIFSMGTSNGSSNAVPQSECDMIGSGYDRMGLLQQRNHGCRSTCATDSATGHTFGAAAAAAASGAVAAATAANNTAVSKHPQCLQRRAVRVREFALQLWSGERMSMGSGCAHARPCMPWGMRPCARLHGEARPLARPLQLEVLDISSEAAFACIAVADAAKADADRHVLPLVS